jgi:excisionase family DNA binding protein
MNGLMTTDQAADYLAMSARQVRRLVAERRIAFRRLGRCVRFSLEDLNEYIEASRVVPITASGVWRDLREVS